MKRFFVLLLLFFAALIQVSWVPVWEWIGFVVPVVLWSLFFVSHELSELEALVYAFVSGLFLDLIGVTWFGMQALALVLGMASFLWIKSKWFDKPVGIWLVGTSLGTLVYLFSLWTLVNILPTT